MKPARALTVLIAIGLSAAAVYAQRQKTVKIDNDGDIHIDRRVEIGDRIVNRGMYRISTTSVNGRKTLVFRAIPMPVGGKNMGGMRLGPEVGRLSCGSRIFGPPNEKSGLLIRETPDATWTVISAWFRGEDYRCEFSE